jgi:uncharacterized protein YrrD
MRKGKSIIGKDLLSLEDGARLEKVHDLVVDPAGQRLVALVIDEGGLMSSARVVPTGEVTSFGRDAVVISSRGSIVGASHNDELRALMAHDDKILGKRVYTIEGDEQGSISDIYFDEASGGVLGYEVSGGFLANASKGTSYLAIEDVSRIGSDVVYVQPEVATVLDEQVGGIQGALKDAGAKAGDQLGKVASGAGDSSSDTIVGKRTGSDVEDDTGGIIVPRGRRVRQEDVDAARAAGKLPDLTASVALASAQQAGEGAKDALGTAGDTASGLWDKFTTKVGQMTDATGRRVDEEQTKRRLNEISDAIGRPVTKVILDREDNVVLNLGDIITHAAIQRAHESGGLDSLMSSVYKGEVQFSKDEMRAPEAVQAEATVEKASGGAVVVEELEDKVRTSEAERQREQERKSAEAESKREQREQEREERAREREVASAEREQVASEPK